LLQLLKLCATRTASLLEINTYSKEIQISVDTVKSYIATLEKLFLLRMLPAWSTNLGKRLIKSPKLHLIDTGMVSAICKLTADDWLTKADLFGHLIESYAVQQVISQLSWINDDVHTYHFRDQKKHEVDLVIEKGNAIWGIEMKRSTTISANDYKGLRILANASGNRWNGGVIFYSGEHILATPIKNTFAVPYGILWSGFEKS